jgi:hypothetical protein
MIAHFSLAAFKPLTFHYGGTVIRTVGGHIWMSRRHSAAVKSQYSMYVTKDYWNYDLPMLSITWNYTIWLSEVRSSANTVKIYFDILFLLGVWLRIELFDNARALNNLLHYHNQTFSAAIHSLIVLFSPTKQRRINITSAWILIFIDSIWKCKGKNYFMLQIASKNHLNRSTTCI